MKAEQPTLVRDSQGPIHLLFHQHVGGSNRLVNLIEPALIRKREVFA